VGLFGSTGERGVYNQNGFLNKNVFFLARSFLSFLGAFFPFSSLWGWERREGEKKMKDRETIAKGNFFLVI